MSRSLALLACVAAILTAPNVFAQGTEIDRGNFILHLGDRAIGAETFGVESHSDSLICHSRSYLTQGAGAETIEKGMVWTASRGDWALRYFQSEETRAGETVVRGVLMSPGDTAFTVYFESKPAGGGTAKRLVAPPGRTFVLDSGLYSLFNLICLQLHGKTFSSRPINLLAVGPPDSLLEAQVTDLGSETIRWGARPVQARKLQLSDGATTFLVWASPTNGRMLRLTHEASGLRVEREAPPVRKRSTPPKPGG